MARSRRMPIETAVAEAGPRRAPQMRFMPCRDASLDELVRALRAMGLTVPARQVMDLPDALRRHFVEE